jgi:NADH dehydrogenase (ubiquinone) 1 alpha subcomplex subunit 8
MVYAALPVEVKRSRALTEYQKLEKVVPDQPNNITPVHLRQQQIYAHYPISSLDKPFIPGQATEEKAKA